MAIEGNADAPDFEAIHNNVSGEINAIAAATVASGDLLLIEDVDDSDAKKKVTAQAVANLSAGSPTALLAAAVVTVDRLITGSDGARGMAETNLTVTTGTYSAQTWTRVLTTVANDDLILSPSGTGAFYLGPPADGTATGGNQRGSYAVDLQMARLLSARSATGDYSTIGGGRENACSGTDAAVAGGTTNTAAGTASTVAGGHEGFANAQYATVGGGRTNTASQTAATVAGGRDNTAASTYGAIGGGLDNDISSAGVFGVIPGGQNNASFDAYGWAMGRSALADAPFMAYSANKVAASDAQRGKSQLQNVHLDARTTDATPTVMLAFDTELSVPVDGSLTYSGHVTAHDETNGTVTSWLVQGTISNPAGTPTLHGGSETLVIDNIDGGGTVTLVASATAGGTDYLTFTATGFAATTIRWSAALFVSRAVKTA